MTQAEKVIWLFFAATSIQLAFLQPYVVLVTGEGTNLFSGLEEGEYLAYLGRDCALEDHLQENRKAAPQ